MRHHLLAGTGLFPPVPIGGDADTIRVAAYG